MSPRTKPTPGRVPREDHDYVVLVTELSFSFVVDRGGGRDGG